MSADSPTQPSPESPTTAIPAALQRTLDPEAPWGRKRDGTPRKRPFNNATPLKTVDGKELLPAVVSAALGARTFAQASKPLSDDQKDLLGRALKMDVDEFRLEFSAQLRSTAAGLLDQLQARMNELKPGEIPFALSVMIDKASTLEGRSSLQNASINVVVNNFGPSQKPLLLSELDGLSHTKQAQAVG